MLEPTYVGSAALLSSGEVLIAGGATTGNRTELYDPVTRSFSAGPPMGASRYEGQLIPLGEPAGRVLAVGGYGTASAEIYGHLPEVTLTNNLVARGAGGEFDLVIDGQTARAHAADGESGTLAAAAYHATVTVSAVAVNGSDPADYALRIDCGAAGAGSGPTVTLGGVNEDTTCQLTEAPPAITVINAVAGASGGGHFDLAVGSSIVRPNAADGEQGTRVVAYRSNVTVSETASAGTSHQLRRRDRLRGSRPRQRHQSHARRGKQAHHLHDHEHPPRKSAAADRGCPGSGSDAPLQTAITPPTPAFPLPEPDAYLVSWQPTSTLP